MTNYRFWGALIVGVILSHFVLKAQDNSAFTKSEIQILFEGKTGDHSVCYRIPALAVARESRAEAILGRTFPCRMYTMCNYA